MPLVAIDPYGNVVRGDVSTGFHVRGKHPGITPTDEPRYDDAPVSEINLAARMGSATRIERLPEPTACASTRQIYVLDDIPWLDGVPIMRDGIPFGRHSFGVVADPHSRKVENLFSYGEGPDGRLIRKQQDSKTYWDDLAAFTERNNTDSKWHAQVVQVPSSAENFRAAGNAVSQLLDRRRTDYVFWPFKSLDHGNSNTAASAQINAAIQRERPGSSSMRPPDQRPSRSVRPLEVFTVPAPAPGWDHRIDGRGNITDRDWRWKWRW